MKLTTNQRVFFTLLQTGLWKKEASLLADKKIDFSELYRLAEEQSVVGLIVAGIDWLYSRNPGFVMPKADLLRFVSCTLQLEEQNISINEFLEWLMERLREENIFAILVKGQGIAQCYERSLWRASGDIDLLLDAENYERAKKVLLPIAQEVEREYVSLKHQGMTISGVVVELHGTLHSRLSKRIDKVVDEAQDRCLHYGEARAWRCGKVDVLLPSADNDVVFVFTHILHHFFIEGVGLRQICDWCRLLWKYRLEIDMNLLEKRLKKMGLMSEWKSFAALAVDWLGMPVDAMPLYSSESKWKLKASRIMAFVMESGNFGHKRQYERSDNKIIRKAQSAWHKMRDFFRHTLVFPWDSMKFLGHFVVNGMNLAVNNRTINKS